MANILFLTGASNVGKSTLIYEVARAAKLNLKGFFARELQQAGANLGFELCAASQLQVPQPVDPVHIFIDRRVQPAHINPQVFAEFGVALLQDCQPKDVVLLDEIGGIELLVPEFMQALQALFLKDLTIIGVFKAEVNYQRQQRQQHFDVTAQRQQLLQAIAAQQGRVLPVAVNQEQIRQTIQAFLNI